MAAELSPWISDRNDFNLQATPMLPTKFQVNWSFSSGEDPKYRFSRWPPWRISWISNQKDFSYLWSTNHPTASYQVSSQLVIRFRRSVNRFSRWQPWWSSWSSDRKDFSYFWSTSHPDASNKVSSQLAQECGRNRLLNQIVDAARRTPYEAWWTTDIDRSQ